MWREQTIGSALVRQVCERCNEVHLRKQAHQGLDVEELRQGTLFELRPEMFTAYTKPEFLRAMEEYDRRQAS